MKKLICVLFCFLLLPLNSFADELPSITFEQLVSGEYYGQEVEVNAKAVPMAKYYNLTHFWSIEKEDGTFEIVDKSETRWCLSEEDYKRASKKEQNAIDNQNVLVLTVYLRKDGLPNVSDFRLPGTMGVDSQIFWLQIGCVVLLFICAIVLVAAFRSIRKNPPKRRPVPIKTRFVDSSHTVTSQTSTTSAIGRAVAGGMLAGSLGAIVGAGTARQKHVERHSTTFMVYYDDGSRKAETVMNGTHIYDEYMKLLDMD